MVRSLWGGRALAFTGILFVALNLRTAVTSVSPIVQLIGSDIVLGSIELSLLGMVPPAAFALSGLLSSRGIAAFGLERLLSIAIAIMIVGLVTRALSMNYEMLLSGTVIALMGAGIGSVILPSVVKRYFSDRIGMMTALYVSALAVSVMIPAMASAPLAEVFGWRGSLGFWAAVAGVGLVPWLGVMKASSRSNLIIRTTVLNDGFSPTATNTPFKVWLSPTAWVVALLFSITTFHAYATFAWLPQALVEATDMSSTQAGLYLAIFAFVGLPGSLIVPTLTSKVRSPGRIAQVALLAFIAGYLGLLCAPSFATAVWVILIGAGSTLLPFCLTIINLRSRTEEGTAALSGFVQGLGYGLGALGPLLVGFLRSATDGWVVPISVLILTALAGVFFTQRLNSRIFVEDES